MAPTIPLGTSTAGSLASSAAKGTPSIARNNHIPKGKAAHTPCQPKGKYSFAPAILGSGAMSNKLAVSKLPNKVIAVAKIAKTARAVITIISFSASPAPIKCMLTKMK